jgi:protein tyrosine phosphatase (PTP) superfamily phosphohydrolase (DUF442 family)
MAPTSTIAEPAVPLAVAPRCRRARAPLWRRRTLILAGLVVLLAILWEPLHVFVGDNVHAVIPGEIYRGAQPDESLLRILVKRHGIRTIVNLRGACYPHDWYVEEAQAAQDLGLALEDVCFSAGRWPSQHEMRRFVEVLDRSERPIYLHCRHGADRTGLASVIALVLCRDAPYEQARRHLSFRYGHAPVGRSTVLDRFFEAYEKWLKRSARDHSPAALRQWLLEEYRGGLCQAVFEDVAPLQTSIRVGDPISWRLHIRNTSPQAWQFKPTRTAGIHLGFYLWDADGRFISAGRGAMLDKTVAPGDAITLTLVLPPVKTPGRYRVLIDLIEEGHCWFFQTGSEPYEEEIDVRE